MSNLDSPEFQPERHLLTTRAEYVAGFEQLLGLTRTELRVFDPDLSQFPLNSQKAVDALRDFLARRRDNKLYIAVHDPDYVAQRLPRMMALLAIFGASIHIHQTQDDAARVQDCFVLADDDHYVRRPVAVQSRGVLVLNDPKDASKMRERFEEIWQSSVLAVSASTSGL